RPRRHRAASSLRTADPASPTFATPSLPRPLLFLIGALRRSAPVWPAPVPSPGTFLLERAGSIVWHCFLFKMPSASDLPDVSSLKLSELKKELALYGIDCSNFFEKQEFTSALKNARETLPRPSTTYREVEPSEEEIRAEKERERRKKSSRSSRNSSSSSRRHNAAPSSSSGGGGGGGGSSALTPAPAPPPPTATAPAPAPQADAKRLLAARSSVTALQQIREHPSEKLLGERNGSFLPGSPFSFALHGSLREDDAAIIRIPEGVCLRISAASVERKAVEAYLQQKGSIGVSLKISTEENPQLMPVWTFDKEKSATYTVSDLGLRVCGPRKIRLLAFMEMGFRSGASVDVFVFGSVGLDRDKF
ncbi:hypothetical protein ACHAWF_014438, partial [Thalassiosira exigua]